MEINFYEPFKHCEGCGNRQSKTQLDVELYDGGICITLCPECEYKLYDALRERQIQKLIHGYASNE